MTTWKLVLEYDGRLFSGWQRQTGARTVQEVVDTTLTQIFGGERIVLHVAGRTDAGVHALGQVTSFRANTVRDPHKVWMGLNALLPEDVVCRSAEIVPDTFHARFSARGKTYRYLVLNQPMRSAFWVGRALLIRRPLDWEAIATALPAFEGTHDFSAFRGPRSALRNPVRPVEAATLGRREELHALEFSGPGFLRYQIRIMVGTLLEIGAGRRPAGDIPRVLASKDRNEAGRTARPDGLYLVDVRY